MGLHDKPPRYRSYLLRFWEERGARTDVPGSWRFSLEDPHTGERMGFASLDRLIVFLGETIGKRKPPNTGPPP